MALRNFCEYKVPNKFSIIRSSGRDGAVMMKFNLNKLKNVLTLFFIFSVCCGFLFLKEANAETIQGKKMVFFVADDSTSMIEGSGKNENRWSKALYAMEVLAGLLNPDDYLKIYYLNDPKEHPVYGRLPWTASLTSENIQTTMDEIISKVAEGGTPFTSVQKAYEDMKEESKNSGIEYDKYWLVIFTDGRFDPDSDHPNTPIKSNELEAGLKSFTQGTFGPDGQSKLQVIYCTIGKADRIIIDEDKLKKEGIFSYDSEKYGGIVETMGIMADQVSGRTRFSGSDLSWTSENSFEISSPIPLFNFVVLVQGGKPTQDNKDNFFTAETDNGTQLQLSRTAKINEPNISNKQEIFTTPLYGYIATVDNGKDLIHEGTYTITFNADVDPNNVIVLFEPALEIRLNHYIDGTLLQTEPSASDVYSGQSYAVTAEVYEYGTNRLIDLEKLPLKYTSKIEIDIGREHAESSALNEKAEIQALTGDEVKVTATLTLDSFNDITTTYYFTPQQEPLYRVNIPNDPNGVQDSVLTATTEQLKPGKRIKYIDFVLQSPDSSIEELIRDGSLAIETDADFYLDPAVPYDISYPDQFTLRIYPHYQPTVDKNAEHYVLLKSKGGTPVSRCQIVITDPTFTGQFDPAEIAIDEAAFSGDHSQQFFVFTLYADGDPADPNDYPNKITFSEPTGTISVKAQTVNGKWEVTFEPAARKTATAGDYDIIAGFDGTEIARAALKVTELDPSKADGRFSPNPLTVDEAAMRDPQNKPTLSFTLIVDGKDINASLIQDQDIEFEPISGNLNLEWKKNNSEWEITVSAEKGKTLDPDTYEIRAIFRGKEIPTHGKLVIAELAPSKYAALFEPDSLSVSEVDFRTQPQTFTFTLLADGRKIGADEINESDLVIDALSGDLNVSKVKQNGSWEVTVEAIPGRPLTPGIYEIGAKYRNHSLPETGKLELAAQPIENWSVMPEPQRLSRAEAELRDQPEIFTFTLKVNGVEVEAEDYDPLTFEVVNEAENKTLTVQPEIVDHKWQVKVEYEPGMPLGTYSIKPKFRNEELNPPAELNLTETAFRVEADAVSIRQSELSQGIGFPVMIFEENTPISPEGMTWKIIDDSGQDVPDDQLRAEKISIDPTAMTLHLKVNGKLRTEAKTYKILLSHQDMRGNVVTDEIPVNVLKSDYKITPDKTQPLEFNSVEEFEKNNESIYFAVTVDGRDLSDEEMQEAVSSIEITPNDSATNGVIEASGCRVTPKAQPGWFPYADDIEYELKYTFEDVEETIKFIYHKINYLVTPVSGSGTVIEVDDLYGNKNGVVFEITREGTRLTYNEVNTASLDIRSDLSGIPLDHEINSDGTISVFPASHPMFGWKVFDDFCAILRPGGIHFQMKSADMRVILEYKDKNVQGEGTLTIRRSGTWLHYLTPWLILLGAIILIILYAIKKRFGRDDRMYFCKCTVDSRTIRGSRTMQLYPLASDFWHFILPVVSEQTEVYGLPVRAAPYGVEVLVGGRSVVKALSDNVDVHTQPKVSNPIYSEAIKPGWHPMNADDMIVILDNKGGAVLYKYQSSK